MIITRIVVVGESSPGFLIDRDTEWCEAMIDGGQRQSVRVGIRTTPTGLPLTVYINGNYPLYPTIVYDVDENILGFSPGKIGLSIKDIERVNYDH